MKKSAFTEEQIPYTLRQGELGTPGAEFCRKLGSSEQTFYRWQRRFAGRGVAALRRWRQLEAENRKLTQRVADLTLDKPLLQEVSPKKLERRLNAGSWCSLCGLAFTSVRGERAR
jgi:putative transposase